MKHRSARGVYAAWVLLGCLVCTPAALGSTGQTGPDHGARRALLVGIDRYQPDDVSAKSQPEAGTSRRKWKDLRGAVNDVRALREVLIHRFGFRPDDVVVLENQAATRQAILTAFQRHLIAPARSGDHSLFYYAGHGSRIRNSRSTELDGKDETIVPADANTADGERKVVDIRDKEWDRLFTQVLDRGAWLTALFDSCHSGSISRGAVPVSAATRFLDEDERDVAFLLEPDVPAHPPGQEPERREGALIISASQEDQQAKETVQVAGTARQWHGAFSLALMQSLNELPAQASADRLFDRVTARLAAEGHLQDPVLAGPASRRHAPLLGDPAGHLDARMRVNLVQAYAADDVELQGGAAVGLTRDTELVSASAARKAQEVRLRITDVRGLIRSRAKVVNGNWRELKAGDEFEVVRRGMPPASTLPVWIGPAVTDVRGALALARDLAAQAPGRGVTLVDDPTAATASHVLSWNGEQWLLWSQADRPVLLGTAPRAADILSRLGTASRAAGLFLNVPPTKEVARQFDGRRLGPLGATVAAKPDESVYALTGRVIDSHIEYAWVLARASGPDKPGRVFPLPERTSWSQWSEPDSSRGRSCEAGGLPDCLGRLGKLYYWLTVGGASGEERFPYRLVFSRQSDRTVVDRGELVEGLYRMVLRADPGHIELAQKAWGLQPRYVYVFVIDREGRCTQLFPNAASREYEHLLPSRDDLKRSPEALAEIPLGESGVVTIQPPYGVDTYLVITSAHAIPYLAELVESGPVMTDGRPLRGEQDWSIDRMFLRSTPARPPGT